MSTKWIYKSYEEIPKELKDFCQDDIFATLLLNRGISNLQKAKEFLEPEQNCKESSPYSFVDMMKVVERISKAIAIEEKIVIFGDFDADGVTSTSLLFKTLKYLGANVEFYIPDRATEGHGLNNKALITLKTKHKAKLVITVDCGISNIKEIKLMKGFGVDVIVSDHHEAGEELPEAFAIINPKAQNALKETLLASEIESLNYLAGVGVAYKIACALLEKYGKDEFRKEILPFVAIGTIADVVPLLGENRLLVRKGIDCIRKNCPLGIKALIDLAGYNLETFDAQSVAFGIAPRVNAVGRLEHSGRVVELFTSDNVQQIELNAKYMDDCNRIRQALCDNIFEEALEQISSDSLKQNKAIILFSENWHVGIIGIVASKLCERFYRPVFIIKIEEDNVRCSARSIEGLNLYDTLCEIGECFTVFGGHSMAAGFSADRKNFDKIVEGLHQIVNENLADEFMVPRVRVEGDLRQSDLNLDFVKKLQLLEPCGANNPSPLFSLKDIKVKQMKTIGSNSNHLKVFFEGDLGVIEGVFWGKSQIDAEVAEKVDVVFSPKINVFMDKTTIQLELCDYKSISKKEEKPKIIDHRKKDNAVEMFLNYLKISKTSISIFAENQKTLEFLDGKNLFNANIINRLNVQKTTQVVFLDLPAEKEIFWEVTKKASPKVIHIIGNSFEQKDSAEILKLCSGMLKYADGNLGGVVDLHKFASKLCLSQKMVVSCLNLLDKAEVIEVLENNEEKYKIKFLKSKDLTYIKKLEEYEDFQQELSVSLEFDI